MELTHTISFRCTEEEYNFFDAVVRFSQKNGWDSDARDFVIKCIINMSEGDLGPEATAIRERILPSAPKPKIRNAEPKKKPIWHEVRVLVRQGPGMTRRFIPISEFAELLKPATTESEPLEKN